MQIGAALNRARARLQSTSDSPALDAELLLAWVLKSRRSYLHTWPERELDGTQQAAFEALVEQRMQGMPVAYLLGEAEFWSLTLKVTEHTLIPRPETELLVEQALALIPEHAQWDIADLGTGSGAIALALASERPACRVHAVETDLNALAVARENAARLGLDVEFHHGSWFEPLAGRQFQLIVSNPPYVASADPHLSGEVRHEPEGALVSGEQGLDDLSHLVSEATGFLTAPGWLLVEHGYDQGEAVSNLFKSNSYVDIRTEIDLGGQDRIGLGRRP
ncbi:MAG: peptide chain release factor N(5)-glutamine methyltransferase [Gammaproteobacteria bacterium]|nr:peptide chain release factor N(5)-glutamine methyltransferase [Gammaproteobacteria bacterium]